MYSNYMNMEQQLPCQDISIILYSGKFSRVLIFAVVVEGRETAKFVTSKIYDYAACMHGRNLKCEKLQNAVSTKITTLENFPLYSNIITIEQVV